MNDKLSAPPNIYYIIAFKKNIFKIVYNIW